MSDTANEGNLASFGELDARLKRTDENRWLALRYAPGPDRRRLVVLYLLNQELQRVLQVREAMIGKIRLQWWRETLEQIAGDGPVRRHDLSEALAACLRERRDLFPAIGDLVDRYDDILDDHLHHGGHEAGSEHAERHFAAEAALARLAGLGLDRFADAAQCEALSRFGEANLAIAAASPDAGARLSAARRQARRLPARLWPAIAHIAAASPKGAKLSPLARRWRIFRAVLMRRL